MSCRPSAYCANFCDPSPIHDCPFNSCCGSSSPCQGYNHICAPRGCPCPCLRPYGSTVIRPICYCCCPPPPKIPTKCMYAPKFYVPPCPPPCPCPDFPY